MRRNLNITTIIMIILLIASCASTPVSRTDIIGVWNDNNYDKKLSNILVISLADELGIREKAESIVVSKLDNVGLRATASSDIMPADKEINRQSVKEAIKGKKFDGVLVSRLLSVDRSVTYVPPEPDTTIDYSFSREGPNAPTPGYTQHHSVATVQIDLYDIASEHLVWSLTASVFNYENVTDLVNTLSDTAIRNLRAKNLI